MSNKFTCEGNLTRDPELRYTSNGTPLCTFSIADNRRYQVNGEWREETSFFDVTVWRQLAENVADSCQKGTHVMVTGTVKQERWTDNNGNNRSKHVINADMVGVSLRWATASVTKNPSRGESNSGYQGSNTSVSVETDQDSGYDPFNPGDDEDPF